MKKQLDVQLPWGIDYCPVCGSIKTSHTQYCVDCLRTKLRSAKIKRLIWCIIIPNYSPRC